MKKILLVFLFCAPFAFAMDAPSQNTTPGDCLMALVAVNDVERIEYFLKNGTIKINESEPSTIVNSIFMP